MKVLTRLLLPAVLLLLLPAPAWAGSPGHWTTVSSGDVPNIALPGVLRGGDGPKGELQVVYERDDGTTASLVERAISPSGVAGPASIVEQGWSELSADPKLVYDDDYRSASGESALLTLFAGIQNDDNTNLFSAGNTYGAWTLGDGQGWATWAQRTYSKSQAYTDDGNGAALLDDGTTLTSFVLNGTFHIGNGYQLGRDYTDFESWSLPPGVSAIDTTLVAAAPSDGYLSWYQFGKGQDGTYVRRVYPSLGPVRKAPDSSTLYQGKVASVSPDIDQDTATVTSNDGIHTAYCVGYPTCTAVAVWRLDRTKPVLLHTRDAHSIAIAAVDRGGVWVGWYAGNGTVKLAKSNVDGTVFGPVRSVRTPGGLPVYRMTLDARGKRVDVLVNTGQGISHTQVLPGLELRASIRSWPHDQRQKVRFRVTDAGDAVAGAKVKVGTHHCLTGPTGRCVIVLPPAKAGRLTARATKSGYYRAHLRLRRTR